MEKGPVDVQLLDKQLEAIQRSTKTFLPGVLPMHEWLRSKSSLYYSWHLNPVADLVHRLTAVGVFFAVIIQTAALTLTLIHPATTFASSSWTQSNEADFEAGTHNGTKVTNLSGGEVTLQAATFAHERFISIDNTAGSAQTDYQIKLSLDSLNFDFSATQGDGDDIRFTDSNGTALSYWIESWDSVAQTAVVYIKIPSLPVDTTMIRMYYGNASTLTGSSGVNTFDFFDNFSTLSGHWKTFKSGDYGTPPATSVSNGFLVLDGANVEGGVYYDAFTLTNGVVEADLIYDNRTGNGQDCFLAARLSVDEGGIGNTFGYGPYWLSGADMNLRIEPGHTNLGATSYDYGTGVLKKLGFKLNGTELTGYVNDTQYGTTANTMFASGYVGIGLDFHHESSAYGKIRLANYRVRKIMAREPIITVGAPSFASEAINALDGWSYRVAATISNTTSSELINYQVPLTINSKALVDAGTLQSNGNDIRITASDGTSQLWYWLDSSTMNSPSTKIWVKVPSIPASGSTIIYLYHGNSIAPPASSAPDVFVRTITNLVGDWSLDDTGAMAIDSTGHGHAGTISGATSVLGKFGRALDFTQGSVNIPDDVAFKSTNLSISAWVSADSLNLYRPPISKTSGTGWHDGYAMYSDGGSGMRFFINDYHGPYASANISTGQWVHLVSTYDGTTIRLYVNGTLVGNTPYSGAIRHSNNPLLIGYGNGGYYWDGRIDEVQLYDRALTQDEVVDLTANAAFATSGTGGEAFVRQLAASEPEISFADAPHTLYVPGIFTSQMYDTTQLYALQSISWSATKPVGTSVKLQIRSAANESDLSTSPWFGPTGTSDYYTSSGEAINSIHDGDRWIQYKVFLLADGENVPSFEDLSLAYDIYSPAVSTNTTWPEESYVVQNLSVENGATLTLAGGTSLRVLGDLTLDDAGGTSRIVCQGKNISAMVNGAWSGEGCEINVVGNTVVDSNSSISADGQGYTTQAGPGAGGATSNIGSGAGHGSTGGAGGNGGAGGGMYGDPFNPTDLGSGGGNLNQITAGILKGGLGGGAIKMNVSGSLLLNGLITANGTSGKNDECSWPYGPGGGGSGGSINVVVLGEISGSGTMTANGGVAGIDGCYGTADDGGSGAGGRIFVSYGQNSESAPFSITGVAVNAGSASAAGLVGASGSVAFVENNNLILPKSLSLAEGSTVSYDNITVNNGALVTVGGGSTLSTSGTLLVSGNSTVSLLGKNRSLGESGVGVTITATNLQVDSGSTITASGQGYVAEVGPGHGTTALNDGVGSGGGNGGAGGNGGGGALGGVSNGDQYAPTDFGSGGGKSNGNGSGGGAIGGVSNGNGSGGGAIRIDVTNVVTLDGAITANGANGTGFYCPNGAGGGGAGGSIYVTVGNTINGSGSIAANGGAGGTGSCAGTTDDAGGGAGGRVAIYFDQVGTFLSGQVSASGGSGVNAGSTGTVVFVIIPTVTQTTEAAAAFGARPTIVAEVADAESRSLNVQIQYINSAGSCESADFTEATTIDSSSVSDGWSDNGVFATTSGTKTATYAFQEGLESGEYCWRVSTKATTGNYTGWIPWTTARSFIVDADSPLAPTIVGLSNKTYYSSSSMPASLTGVVADDGAGLGLAENSSTLTLSRSSDSKYWSGTNWQSDIVNLSVSHAQADPGATATWTLNTSLPQWLEDDYAIQVTSNDTVNNTSSQHISFFIDSEAPSVVGDLRDGSGDSDYNYTVSDSSYSGSWSAANDSRSGLSLYQYALGTSAGGTNVKDWTDNGLATTVTIDGLALTDGTTYYFSVRAVDAVGNVSSVQTSNGIAVDKTAPTNVNVFDGSTAESDNSYWNSINSLAGSWSVATDAVSGLSLYQYALGTSAGGTNVKDWTDNGLATTVTIDGLALTDGTTYYFSVRAVDAVGNVSSVQTSNGITVDSVRPTALLTSHSQDARYGRGHMPMTVTGSVADNAAGQGLSENSAKLLIQRKSDNTYWNGNSWGGSAVQLSTTHPATVAGEAADWTTNIPESIWSDGNYACVVFVADRAGNISSQNEISFLYDATPPAVPENIVALAGNTSISLTWRNPADSDFGHVLLYRSEQSDFLPGDATKIAETESADVATYMDAGVSNNVTYYYKMQAVDDIGNTSAASMQASARPDSDNPTTPGSPSLSVKIDTIDNVEYTSSKSVEFVFAPSTDENSGIKQYLVTIGTVSGGSDILNRAAISSTKYPHAFNNDGLYFVRVMAEDQLGNTSSESRELAIIVDSTAPAVPTETLMYDASDRANEIFAVAFSFVVPDDLSGILGYVVAKNGSDILDHSNGLMTDGVSINEKTGKGTYLVVAESDKSDSYTIRAIDKARNSSVGQAFSLAGTATVDLTGQQVGGAKITLASSVVGEGKLEISAVEANPSTVVGEQTQATVIWRSTVPSTTKVEYGLTENYEFATKLDEGLNSYHTAILSELTPDTTYHYRVISTDKYGNSTASGDATFTTNAQQEEESVFEKIIKNITLTFSTIYNQVSSAIRQLL